MFPYNTEDVNSEENHSEVGRKFPLSVKTDETLRKRQNMRLLKNHKQTTTRKIKLERYKEFTGIDGEVMGYWKI